MTEVVLDLFQLTKSYKNTPVLKGIDLQVTSGRLVGIVGENGSGKSTLLKLIVGFLQPDSGFLVRHGSCGYCPQEALVYEGLTPREHFALFGTAYGLKDWIPRMERLAERLNFTRYLDKVIGEVSGGTRQKLNLALALLHDPPLLVLDEPYSGLDWETYQHLWNLSDELKERGKSLLIVSHLIHDRGRFDEVYDLVGGRLEPEPPVVKPRTTKETPSASSRSTTSQGGR